MAISGSAACGEVVDQGAATTENTTTPGSELCQKMNEAFTEECGLGCNKTNSMQVDLDQKHCQELSKQLHENCGDQGTTTTTTTTTTTLPNSPTNPGSL